MKKYDSPTPPSVNFVRNVDWNLFKVFYEIGRQGGIGSAARALNKQQPSVSAALQRLESFLDTHLCTRTARGIELTVQGHQVMAACEAMYLQVQSCARLKGADVAHVSGSLTLSLISNLYLVPRLTTVLQEFHRRYPLIDVRLDVAPWRRVLNSLKNGEVELAFCFADTRDSNMMFVPLTHQLQQIYCGPQHPLFGKPPVSPNALEGDAFVISQDEPTAYVDFRQRHALGRQIGGVAENLQERMWLIQLGMGIGILPKPVVEASNLASVLWPLLPEEEALKSTIYLLANNDGIRSAPAQLFLETAMEHLNAD
ncbi:LysR family transcriptional regulator [Hydrogenophaga sp. BPS33]|uniref:LysR family transcriptional regulator n=1 Tax=Hydrogenophaga sp. BPS33 TaxID=2651974 RepID=UPI00131FDDC8|nr:LysR family transcriptional regulator [Hydrogenophaga sp. BPS33]QHE83522.1 LysR family transcriptional regulator [Hydrogenophaga sp. BPS33]